MLLKEAGVTKEETEPFLPKFPGNTEPPLVRRTAALNKSIAAREGEVTNPAKGTARWLQAQIKVLTDKDTADKALQNRIKAIHARVSAIDTESARVQAEIAQIKGPNAKRLEAAGKERMDAYVKYFENLKREQVTLEQLYAPVQARLTREGAADQEQDLESDSMGS